MAVKRKDKNRIILKTGESQRKNGTYSYRWMASDGKRRTIYAKTLEELRDKEEQIDDTKFAGAAFDSRNATINDAYEIWVKSKIGLKASSLSQYMCSYESHIKEVIGDTPITKASVPFMIDFYKNLIKEQKLSSSTVNIIKTIVDQIFTIMEDSGVIEKNTSTIALKNIVITDNKSDTKDPLTIEETDMLLEFVKGNNYYKYRYPLLVVLLGTGIRVGEAAALCWSDIDFESNLIYISKAAYTYMENQKSVTHITTPKTANGVRVIPMLSCVRSALLDLQSKKVVQEFELDGYSNFVFGKKKNILSTNGLRIGLKHIENSYNQHQEQIGSPLRLPHLYPHIFRHTFATRLCEQGVNTKIVQAVMGHSDISITYNIYVKPTSQMYESEYKKIDGCFPAYTALSSATPKLTPELTPKLTPFETIDM